MGDKNNSNKLMSLHIDDDNLLEKYKTIWTKVEDLKLDALPVFDEKEEQMVKKFILNFEV